MPVMSVKLSEAIVKTTHARDIDDAFRKIFSEYLELKLQQLNHTIEEFQEKWEMTFPEFKTRISDQTLKKDAHSFEVETDFWQWEEAETLREHYQEISSQWM